jgi:hypothetical protein
MLEIFSEDSHPNINQLFFDDPMGDENRKEKLEELFSEFIVPFTDKASSKSGIKELANKGEIILLPAMKQSLEDV